MLCFGALSVWLEQKTAQPMSTAATQHIPILHAQIDNRVDVS
jgi:hypothetical protein